MFPPKARHDLYAQSSVAAKLWKKMGGRMVEIKCRPRAIDKRKADGTKSTRD